MNSQSLAIFADLFTSFLTIVAILLAFRELRLNTRVQRAQFLLNATNRYFSDGPERDLYYDIDYRRLKIDFEHGEPSTVSRGEKGTTKPFLGSEEEHQLDNMLYNFDIIGRILEMGALDPRDARIFAFQAKRVLSNSEVQKYLVWVTSQRIVFGGEIPAHRAAQKLVDQSGLSKADTHRYA